jgi:ribosomal protein S18 acetylase RimI-like enzyme
MINKRDVQFRGAFPTDAEWAIRLIVGSAAARFGHFHADRIDELHSYLKREFFSNVGLFSYKHHIVIEHLGVPIGVVCMFRSLAAPFHSFWTLCHMLRCLGLQKTLSVLLRRRLASGRMTPFSLSSVYGDNLCIEPHLRGIGIGKLTMQYLFHLAAEQGFQYFYCDVGARNAVALQLYQQLGMKPRLILRSSSSSPLDDLIRLRKDLVSRNQQS